jgi:hypothetical protein
VGSRWERIGALLGARWEKRIDGSRLEALHEHTRAAVRSLTVPIVGETTIDVPGSPRDVWDRLFSGGADSSWGDPTLIEFTLPGPAHGQVGHRYGHVGGRHKRPVGFIFEIVEAIPGVSFRTRALSTMSGASAYRLIDLGSDQCRISFRSQVVAAETDVELWRARLAEGQVRHLARLYVELTGDEPPPIFADALAREPDAQAGPADPTSLDPTLVSAAIVVGAPTTAAWELVRDLARAGFPDVEPDYTYTVMAGTPERWVGVRESSIGLPIASVVEILDESPGRRFVAQRVGMVSRTTLELVSADSGSLLTVSVELVGLSDVAVGRWQRALDGYLRHVERELGRR